jgi:hypothetical protein
MGDEKKYEIRRFIKGGENNSFMTVENDAGNNFKQPSQPFCMCVDGETVSLGVTFQ